MHSKRPAQVLQLLLGGCLIAVVVCSAWVSEDAYISFRMVDNFCAGLGLTWNPSERVMASTHPLWLGLLSVANVLAGELYYSSIVLSIGLVVAAAAVLARAVAGSPGLASLGLLLLLSCKAFVDFSTSGLENPLAYLLVVSFAAVAFRGEPSPRRLAWLAWLAGLGVLNRLDSLWLFLPPLALEVWRCTGRRRWLVLLSGTIPLACWTLFSLIYFGGLVPNSVVAKLTLDIPIAGVLTQGLWYLHNSWRLDPLLLGTIVVALLATVRRGRADPMPLAAMLGVLLTLLYVIRIGGDFMSGRFLSVPFVVSVCCLARVGPTRLRSLWLVSGVVIGVGLVNPHSPLRIDFDFEERELDHRSIADERGYYFQQTGMIPMWRRGRPPIRPGRPNDGVARRAVVSMHSIGIDGYGAGPAVHIVDTMGLADVLLARIPAQHNGTWRIGHGRRSIPEGYLDTLKTGENTIAHPVLAEAWDEVRVVTREPLFSMRRMRAIWRLHTEFRRLPPP